MPKTPPTPGRDLSDHPTTRMFSLLVCYDIADDGRRSDISEFLMELGPRVQFSVFECRVRGTQGVTDLCATLEDVIDPLEDQVRVYNFGARQAAPRIIGSRTLEEWRDYVII